MSKSEYKVILAADEETAADRMNELADEGFEFLSMSSHGVASSQGTSSLNIRQATTRICIVMVKQLAETSKTQSGKALGF